MSLALIAGGLAYILSGPHPLQHVLEGGRLKVEGLGVVSLAGVEMPGPGDPCSTAAMVWLKEIAEANDNRIAALYRHTNKDGHVVAWLVWVDTPVLINWQIVSEGWARVDTKDRNPWRGALEEAQRMAQSAKRGIWAEWGCARKAEPEGVQP